MIFWIASATASAPSHQWSHGFGHTADDIGRSVAVDGSGNVYVADADNHRIRMVSPSGVVTTLAGSGTAGFADGEGRAARFDQPVGLAIDAADKVFALGQAGDWYGDGAYEVGVYEDGVGGDVPLQASR